MTNRPLPQKPKEAHPNAGLRRNEGLIGLLFLSPWVLGFILFKVLPILAALVFSLTDFHMLTPEATRFIGLANYVRFLSDIPAWASLAGSLGYFLTTVPLELLVGLALAAIISSNRLRIKGLLRALIFVPSIISAAGIYSIWAGLVDPNSGWLNQLVMAPLGLPPIVANLYEPPIMMMALWSIGPGFLIMYGAIQNIPKEIHEAARMDGAGPLMSFISITMPMISPAIFFSLVINLTTAFGGSVLLDRGYLFNQSLSPMEGYINYIVFQNTEMGYASALAWVMFAMTMVITIFLFRSTRRWVYYPEEAENGSI